MVSINTIAIGWTIAIVMIGVSIAAFGPGLESDTTPRYDDVDDKMMMKDDDKMMMKDDDKMMMKDDDDKMMMKDDDEMMMKDDDDKMMMKDDDEMMMKDDDKMMMKDDDEMMMKDDDEMMMKDDDKMMMKDDDEMMMKDDDEMMMKDDDKMMMKDDDKQKEAQIHAVSIPVGAGGLGCETDNTCYTPTDITINAGDTIVWTNDEPGIPHTVTAGDLTADVSLVGEEYPDGFDSSFMVAGTAFENTFDATGTYPYFCQLHPWMVGTVQVN